MFCLMSKKCCLGTPYIDSLCNRKREKISEQNLVNLNSETHYIYPLYWGNDGFALVSFLVLYFELNNNAFVIVKKKSDGLDNFVSSEHSNGNVHKLEQPKSHSAMLYFEMMKTTGNNNDNRHTKYLVGGTIKY